MKSTDKPLDIKARTELRGQELSDILLDGIWHTDRLSYWQLFSNRNFITFIPSVSNGPVAKISHNTVRVWENSVYLDIFRQYADKADKRLLITPDRNNLMPYNADIYYGRRMPELIGG